MKNKKEPVTKQTTGTLLPKNGFFIGLGSIFNIAGNYFDFNLTKSGITRDSNALYSDWNAIGNDFRAVQ